MKKLQALVSIFILVGIQAIIPAQSARAAGPYYVSATTGNDSNPCTLSDPCKTIIHAVSIASAGETIEILDGTYKETSQITVDKTLTINGAGMNDTIIDGGAGHRVFKINASVAVTIRDLTIQNGKAGKLGGGINNKGALTFERVKIANNSAAKKGGGLYMAGGSASITDSAITNNKAKNGKGGGLYIAGGSASITDSAITNNKAKNGAGIFGNTGAGNIILDRVEISENTATTGTGGILYKASVGTLSMNNVTLSNNTGNVGGLRTVGTSITNIHYSTIVENTSTATIGNKIGGITNYADLTVDSSIIADNSDRQCYVDDDAKWISYGYNIATDTYCDLDGTNDHPDEPVSYGPLGYYGGPTRTHYVKPGTLAVELVTDLGMCPDDGSKVDQRGEDRPQDGNDNDPGNGSCDAGAFEATRDPQVLAITRKIPEDPTTSLDSVVFEVVFSEDVDGVDVGDFSFDKTGSIEGYFIENVAPDTPSHLYTVTVNTGMYDGTLQLNVNDGTDIADFPGNPLSSGFTTGEFYTIHKIYTLTVMSQGPYDGWVLESGEFSGKGGSKNNGATVLQVGDNSQDKQYRTILSFNTADLHDLAKITSAVIKVKKAGVVGTNPMSTHNGLVVDIGKNQFHTLPDLQLNDFQANPTKSKVGKFRTKLYSGWYKSVLYAGGRNNINTTGLTQFRLRFLKDDNDDRSADILKLYSGNAGTAKRPILIIKYYVP